MKDEILEDYVAHRQWATDAGSPLGDRALAVLRSADPVRDAHFLRSLVGQGVEVFELQEAIEAASAVDGLGSESDELTLPPGTWVIPAAQLQGAMVRAYLDFDQRLDEPFLRKERESIERGQGSKIYDVTGWDLADW